MGLRVPEKRRTVIETELYDHLDSRIEVELLCGAGPDEAEATALAAFGDPNALRRALERTEGAFALTARRGFRAGARSLLVFVAAAALTGAVGRWTGDPVAYFLGIQAFAVACGLALLRGSPPGLWLALKHLPLSRPTTRNRALISGGRAYLSVLLWCPPVLAVLMELLLLRGFFFAVMIPYLELWIGFIAVMLGRMIFDALTDTSDAELEPGHDA